MIKQLLLVFVSVKIIIFLIIIGSSIFLPYSKESYTNNFVFPKGEKHTIYSGLKAWDGMHYLSISENGYTKESISNRFFPLYPLTIKIINVVTHNVLISALISSTLFSLLALVVFYLLTKALFTQDIAYKASLFFVVFPTSFYMSVAYSEGLFLFLAILLFYFLAKKQYLLSSMCAFFLIFTRPVGILVVIPLFVWYLLDKKKKKKTVRLPSFAEPVDIVIYPEVFFLALPFLGMILYFLFMQHATGNYFTGFFDQSRVVSGWSVENAFNPIFFIKSLFSTHLQLHSFLDSVLDRVFFVVFIFSLPFIYRYFQKSFFIYSLLLGFVPIFGSFMSYMRYLLPVFPIFMLLGIISCHKKYSFLFFPLLLIFYSMQIVFVVLYGLNYWVS